MFSSLFLFLFLCFFEVCFLFALALLFLFTRFLVKPYILCSAGIINKSCAVLWRQMIILDVDYIQVIK